MRFPRASGVLLHPTSLPGPFGIGDIGPAAFDLVDRLAAAGQSYWQMLPLGPTGYGDSPYNAISAFAGNDLMISPEGLVEDGLLNDEDLADAPEFPVERVDFGAVREYKERLLTIAFERFERAGAMHAPFDAFCRRNWFWLDDLALYRAIKADNGDKAWHQWPDELRLRDKGAIDTAAAKLEREVRYHKFVQFTFFSQWQRLRDHAAGQGVAFIGDIPLYVALDSADVWCNQDKFRLNDDGSPELVSGVPPDYFSKTGQLWGNPIYDWRAMAADRFSWWGARVHWTLSMVDIARIDHFRGLVSAWEVPGADRTAEHGQWADVPGRELLGEIKRTLGQSPLIAEDLGHMTPAVESLRDEFRIPGMRILQFGFGGDAANRDLPHNYVRNSVAYPGTHDNDTIIGWFDSLPKRRKKVSDGSVDVREHVLEYLDSDGREINWDLIRAVWASVSDTAIVQMQDLLSLGSEARMNLPATTSGNWSWRMLPGSFTAEITERLHRLTKIYGRLR